MSEEEYEPDVIFSRMFEPFAIQHFPISQKWAVINHSNDVWRKDNTWGDSNDSKMIKFFEYDQLVDFVYKTFKVNMRSTNEDSN